MPTPLYSQGAWGPQQSAPAFDFFAVTPHDTNDFATWARALYIGGAGNVVAVTYANVPITFVGVPAGSILPIQCKRVNSTSTTATSIVALT